VLHQLPLPLSFNLEHGFEQYHEVGNAEVVAHIRCAACGNGEKFIFLWGDEGSGKSHLLQAFCRESQRFGHSSAYLPLRMLKAFGPEIFDGLEHQQTVCIDDLDLIAGDGAWELVLFDMFNRLLDSGHTLLVSAKSRPDCLNLALPDLQTRLSWGLSLMLRPLDDDGRLAIINQRAKALGLDVSAKVGQFILAHYRRDLPSLMALLDQLDHATMAAQRKLTIPFLKSYLQAHL
jgi:DnaA family protein